MFLERPATARVVPFAAYVFFLGISGLLFSNESPHGQWLYGVKIAVVVLTLWIFRRSYTELRRNELPSPMEWLLAMSMGIVVFVLWINLDQPWALLGTPKPFNALHPNGDINVPLVIIRWIGAALVVPVMEELFWRSFLLRWIQRQDFWNIKPAEVTLKSSLIVAALFGAEHNLWFAGIVAGLAYNWLYIRTGKLWVPIVAHAVTNGVLGIWVLETRNWQFW